VIVTGTPARPDLKRRPMAFVAIVLAYAAFIALLVYWALQLRRAG
jgi:hypothetical protein